VEALLQDLAAEYGDRAAVQETQRARRLHGASLAAYDARPGGRDALGDRLDVMLREQRYAAERQAELGRLLHSAGSQEEAESFRLDLAWAHDDHERATARCTELRHRMAELDRRALRTHAQDTLSFPAGPAGDVFRVREPEGGVHAPGKQTASRFPYEPPAPADRPAPPRSDPYAPDRPATPRSDPYAPDAQTPDFYASDRYAPDAPTPDSYASDPYASDEHTQDSYASDSYAPDAYAPDGRADHDQPQTPAPSPSLSPFPASAPPDPEPTPAAPKQRSKRRPRGSARFAGMLEPEAAPVAVPEVAPPAPAPAVPSGRSPRGARFAGAAEAPVQPRAEPLDEDARRATAETVETLTRLRGEGRSGEAHALLVEAAYWPAARFPLLAAELHRAGLDADWATLLWEAASLPADRLVAAADALVAAGRTADGQQMLRQGVARPAPEIGAVVLGLAEEGRRREIGALLGAYVRVRTPEEAARSAEADPQRLVPLLLEAAQGVSDERHWDLLHALRVAGFTA
ncbi:hypothetical protein, partial [Streptomyces sp. NPDC058272]|uniref:hypothetical protein n=1 Tax=Streptomyces sp. NPDC058272 TaxID=3346415 RepID=UPI0036E23F0A